MERHNWGRLMQRATTWVSWSVCQAQEAGTQSHYAEHTWWVGAGGARCRAVVVPGPCKCALHHRGHRSPVTDAASRHSNCLPFSKQGQVLYLFCTVLCLHTKPYFLEATLLRPPQTLGAAGVWPLCCVPCRGRAGVGGTDGCTVVVAWAGCPLTTRFFSPFTKDCG